MEEEIAVVSAHSLRLREEETEEAGGGWSGVAMMVGEGAEGGKCSKVKLLHNVQLGCKK